MWQKDNSPNRKFAVLNWAEALESKQCYTEATEKCREAISIDPEYAGAHNLLGIVLAAEEDFDEAIGEFRIADALWQKDNSDDRKLALLSWANALKSKKLYKQAAKKCREAISLDPDYPTAYHLLGSVLAVQERLDAAIAQYRKADALSKISGSSDRKQVLWHWAGALHSKENLITHDPQPI